MKSGLESSEAAFGEPVLVTGGSAGIGVYVHVPFCSSTCDFCAFYQEKPEKGDFDRYVDGIARELELLETPLRAETVFWGGGTPGLLTPAHIRRLGGILRDAFSGKPVEWTVEMTPSCVKQERLEALAEIGVTRISFGAQSFQPRLLEALGRMHPRERIFTAYDLLRKNGFENVNIDLMFAIPGQTLEEWEADLREAIALGPEHLSTYCLTFEEDTALYIKLSEGRVTIDEEKEVAFYRNAWRTLAEGGYRQYEVSNYAKPGRECLHNRNTWEMREWIGLGPGGASQFGNWRSSNTANLNEWLKSLEEGKRSTEQREALNADLLAADYLVFGLRLNEGVDLREMAERFGVPVSPELEPFVKCLVEDGLAERRESRLWLTDEGRLVVDQIGSQLLELAESGRA